ncbi:Glycosyl hydrolases family 16 [Chitinophaga costaii]|uniref:Glycosyl hydrolases family 16 n=1 Tax=Chitinophaga costaii TaxID=1335309 RepID=A0A1C4G5Y6_9BACT|nr:glycoside hydrolase family 16 protein [Chitinophaga costaii]PUZ19703.1 hypothetical protein DCM91_20260 [Chitinophaga costaii]SCC63255.1 Glycosyl hydrolases family 16 [Chitinophaga costaii]
MYKRKQLLAIALLLAATATRAQTLRDDFNYLDTTRTWRAMDQKWGEPEGPATHGGVVPANVRARHGALEVTALGSLYHGPVKGHGLNTRIGGALTSRERYASGSYVIRAKICPHPGALSAFWTFYYENDDLNHEIDFEMPGHNQAPLVPDSSDLHYGLVTNWTGVHPDQYKTHDLYFGDQADGQYHTYRFDWHTGGNGQQARVEYYYDERLLYTAYEHIPTHASNFNIGIWFPKWIRKANFDKAFMYVDWVQITPFHEPNDVM